MIALVSRKRMFVLNEKLDVLWKADLKDTTFVGPPLVTAQGIVAVATSRGLTVIEPPL